MQTMVKVSYERWKIEDINNGGWEIISKTFTDKVDAKRFILRIQDNVIVRRIWLN